MHTQTLLLELGVILVLLSGLGALARRLGLPQIPLYLLAGLALGDGGIVPVPAAGEFVQAGATIGVVLLLLTLGLEFTTAEFAHSLRRHVPSAVLDLVLNATPGAIAGWLLGLSPVGILALAGATWVSSSGIAARLLNDLGRLGNRETPAVLAVLVIEDFAMAVYLPVLAVLSAGGDWWQALLGVLAAAGAVGTALAASHRWGHHASRWLVHPDAEQLMLRVLGTTLVVAALAELVNISAAVGAFLVGLTLTGDAAKRARAVLTPLRDLFAATFFLSIGFAVNAGELVPVLPAALALAVTGIATKVWTGRYAAARDGVGRRGRIRAGTALIARGEFSIVIIGLAGAGHQELGPLITAYVLILASAGPLTTRWAGRPTAQSSRAARALLVDDSTRAGLNWLPLSAAGTSRAGKAGPVRSTSWPGPACREMAGACGTFAPTDRLAAGIAWQREQIRRGGTVTVDDTSPVVAGAPETRQRHRRLRAFNVAAGVLLAAEATYMLLASNDLALPVTASYLRTDPVAVTGPTLPQVVFSLRIGPAVAFFLALAAVDHLLVASPRVHGWYERGLARRANYARWIEYSVSASVMIVLIGLFVGIRDLAAVAAIFTANTAMILFGLLMERQQRPGAADWSAFWFGSLVGIAGWALIAVYVAQPDQVPGFVYAITIVQFALFFSFAVNMALQYAQIGRWRDYIHGEVAYITLSLTAKSLLAWLIFANVLRA